MSEHLDDYIETLQVVMVEEQLGMRLDRAVAQLFPDYSRTRLQGLIDEGECLVNGQICKTPSRKMEMGDMVILTLPQLIDDKPQPENIPLDIIFEDEDLLVINKAVGMVVHPAVGHQSGTLVNALLHHCGESLSGINGVKRPGIVHRLDKDTSGLMMVAKNDLAHHHLSEQLQDRSLSRVYLALVLGIPFPPRGRVQTMIGRHQSNRLKMAVHTNSGREAITNYNMRESYHNALSLIECHLETGRTHQIRVHMEHIGYPLIGDVLYGAQTTKLISKMKKGNFADGVIEEVLEFPHQALHATEISFIHPRNERKMSFSSSLPEKMMKLILRLKENHN